MGHSVDQSDGMSFGASETVQLINSQIDEFIEQEIEPLESDYDHFLGEQAELNVVDDDGTIVQEFLDLRDEIQRLSADAGFYAMHIPEEYGGGGLNTLENVQVLEHIHDRNPQGFHEMIHDHISVTGALIPCAHDDFQREKYFEPTLNAEKHMAFGLTEPDHGSDATWMDTTAEKDGDEWVINGTKCFTSNSPYVDFIMVHARTSGEDGSASGISTFLVDSDNPGWEVGRTQFGMGATGDVFTEQAYNHFNDCRVPEAQMVGDEGRGFIETAMKWVGGSRLNIPAIGLGRSQWMFDACVDYAEDRSTFGEPIGSRQFVQDMLAEMRVSIEQVRWLTRYAAWKYDQGDRDARWLQSAAKMVGSNVWNDVADKAVEIHGGAGYMRSLPFEHEYRKSRGYRIVEGTEAIHKRGIATHFLDL